MEDKNTMCGDECRKCEGKCGTSHGNCSGGGCGCKGFMGMGYMGCERGMHISLARIIVALAILGFVFAAGIKLGEIKAYVSGSFRHGGNEFFQYRFDKKTQSSLLPQEMPAGTDAANQ